ncbi:PLAC8 family-domain-containing protein [Staphylotrichum tortipilum]|uniref:PLAC8 family-domain-containing protein n=1 Tax=Staphylotrichum tortipilum TaxID=2831512 RepID=A0AAN6MPJ5_9PEZI|nr:PLAC8 family-domain-containing protein [Staphylotrichum longicolle]
MSQVEPIKPHEWQDGLCDICDGGHCMEGCFCPCLLVNKTDELIEEPDAKKVHGCGVWCIGHFCLNLCGGFGGVLSCIQRTKIRKRYGIEGGVCGDFWRNLCCPCCSVIQQYKEVEKRRDALVNKAGYQRPAGMPRMG